MKQLHENTDQYSCTIPLGQIIKKIEFESFPNYFDILHSNHNQRDSPQYTPRQSF